MKNVRVFLSKNFPFLEKKFSIYLNRRVFVMVTSLCTALNQTIGTLWTVKVQVFLVCQQTQ